MQLLSIASPTGPNVVMIGLVQVALTSFWDSLKRLARKYATVDSRKEAAAARSWTIEEYSIESVSVTYQQQIRGKRRIGRKTVIPNKKLP